MSSFEVALSHALGRSLQRRQLNQKSKRVACIAALTLSLVATSTSAFGQAADTTTTSASSRGTIPVESSNTGQDKAIELSPFEVKSDDKGYYASSALSGTRFNTRLEDLAAPITVVTKQQLDDTAAVDINDIFRFESNTEGSSQFTSYTIDRGNIVESTSQTPSTANRIRGLNSANVTQNGFTMTPLIPVDSYNIDSVEISRGPNSTIAGLGGSSGTVNLNTATALLTRDVNKVSGRFDNFGGWRSTLDFNRRFLNNKAAIRVLGMSQNIGYEQKPSYDRQNRGQVAFTVKPFSKTVVKFTAEVYNDNNKRPNVSPPRDSVTYWQQSGSPTWNPITQQVTINGKTALNPLTGLPTFPVNGGTVTLSGVGFANTDTNTLPAGLNSQGGGGQYTRINEFIDQGQIQLLTVGRLSQNASPVGASTGASVAGSLSEVRLLSSENFYSRQGTTYPLYVSPVVTNRAIYDWKHINFQAPNSGQEYSRIYTGTVDQGIFDTPKNRLDVQLAWRRENYKSISHNYIGNGGDGVPNVLYVDVNQTRLDGTPNPNFLRPYAAGNEPQIYIRPSYTDQYRAQAAYQLDMTKNEGWTKWLGHHSFTGYGEYALKEDAPTSLRYHDHVVDNHGWSNTTTTNANLAGAAQDNFYPIYYMGDGNGQNVDYAAQAPKHSLGTNNYYWYDGTPGIQRWNNESVNIQDVYFSQNMLKTKIRTQGIVLQDFFWKDRIIPTFGFRRDRQYTITGYDAPQINSATNPNVTTDTPGYGYLNDRALYNYGKAPKRYTAGNTKTEGIVVKPLSWLYLHFNKSNSFSPVNPAYSVYGDLLVNPTGKSKEYGFTLSLLDQKLTIRVNKYDTTDINSRSGAAAVAASRAPRMDLPLQTNNNGDRFNLYTLATGIGQDGVTNPNGVPWIPNYTSLTPAQQDTALRQAVGFGTDYVVKIQNQSLADINNLQSKGYEIEANYNPNQFWTVKLTGAQQVSIATNQAPYLGAYIAARLPSWTTIKDPILGGNWWTNSYGGTRPYDFFTANVQAPYILAATLNGKANPQTRKYSSSFLTSYRLAGISDMKIVKAITIGGTLRYSSKAAIGFLAAAPDADGVVRSLDANKPVYDGALFGGDVLAKYDFKLSNDRIKATLQLNVQNVFENGKLRPIAVNPDGQVWNYRMVNPRQYLLQLTLAL